MQSPARILIPKIVDAGLTDETVFEDQLPIQPLLSPKLLVWNAGTADIEVLLLMQLILGVTGNPLTSGTFQTILFQQTLAAGATKIYDFAHISAIDTNAVIPVRHTLRLVNSSLLSVKVHSIISGLFEASSALPDVESFRVLTPVTP